MFFYLGDKVNVITDRARISKNKRKQWKYGYDPEIDTVIISKDGTLGDVYNVQGLNIGLPQAPPDNEIINYGLNPYNQVYTRRELPEELTDKHIAKTISRISGKTEREIFEKRTKYINDLWIKHSDFIDSEFDKRENGVWYFINGKPHWIVGTYDFIIQNIREEVERPNYRQIQNELMMFWEACKADNRCYGMQYIKNRRIGASFLSIGELLDAGTLVEDKILSIISKTGRDSRKIFGRLVKAFKRLPIYYRPLTDGTNTPKQELVFDEPTKRKSKDYIEGIGEGLGTVIGWLNTALNSGDGDATYRLLADESGKYPPDVPFSSFWDIVKTSLTRGTRITGKAMVVSTVNPMKKGGSEYKVVYDNSNLEKRDGNGQTKSGLYPLFIPARYCLEGKFDRFGYTIIEDPKKPIRTDEGVLTTEGTITWLNNKSESLKDDPEILNEFKRQFPETIRDAFRDTSEDCEFNIVKLLEQIDHNTYELEDKFASNGKVFIGNNDLIRGNLSWKDGVRFSSVVWNHDPENGRFFVKKGCLPPKEIRNSYQKNTKFGITAFEPMYSDLGTIGVDPYNRSRNADGRGSKGSMHLVTRNNTYDLPNNTLIMEYIDRPKKVEIFFEEALMAAIFWSVPLLAELSNEGFLKFIKDNGFRHFSMNNPFKKWIKLNPTEKELGGAPPQDSKIGDEQFHVTNSYVEDMIGVYRGGDVRENGEMGDFPFTRTLHHIKDVDTTNRTKYDAYISFSLSLLGNRKRIKRVEKENVPISGLFTLYDNSGNISKVINRTRYEHRQNILFNS